MSSTYSRKEQEQLIADVMDPERVVLMCSKHGFVADGHAGSVPTPGCKDCHQAHWTHIIGKVPPHKRREVVENMIEVAMDLIQAVKEGKAVPQFYRHPRVTIEKDTS